MKRNQLAPMLAAGLLLCSLFSSCGSSDADLPPADSPEADSQSEEETMNPSRYPSLSENYTENEDGSLTAAVTAPDHTEPRWSAAFYEDLLLDGDFAAEGEIALESLYSNAGLLFRASESSAYDGFEGYALTVRDKRIYLYETSGTKASGLMMNELAHRSIERVKTGDFFRLRVEREGNTFRLYLLDDAEGVEPWPEFEFTLNEHRGVGIGFVDNGEGASFRSLTVEPYTAQEASEKQYKNPVFSELQAADPGVLKYEGKYYCYSTSAPIGYYVYVSDDLVNWSNAGLCCEAAWGMTKNGYYWAPEVVEKDGKFYMVMSVEEHLGFAVADSPLGPFVPLKTWQFDGTIDGHIFLDDDGKAYLYYVSWRSGHEYGIYGCELELNDGNVTVKTNTERLLLSPKEPWEKVDGSVTEGPFVLKHNGSYYLTYSGTGYTSPEYAVGYAVADSPLGTYERYAANPVLSCTSKVRGPGHHSFTVSPDGSELIIVYHIHKSLTEVHPRQVCIDRVRFAPTASGTDRLEIYGPTHTSQNYPN